MAVASLTLQHPPSSTAGRAALPPAQWKREEPGRLQRSRRCAKSGAGRAPSRRGRTRVSTLGSRACALLCATGSPNEAQASRVAVLRTLLPPRSAENQPQNLEVRSSPDLGRLGDRESGGWGAEEERNRNADPRLWRRKKSGSLSRQVVSSRATRIPWIARLAAGRHAPLSFCILSSGRLLICPWRDFHLQRCRTKQHTRHLPCTSTAPCRRAPLVNPMPSPFRDHGPDWKRRSWRSV